MVVQEGEIFIFSQRAAVGINKIIQRKRAGLATNALHEAQHSSALFIVLSFPAFTVGRDNGQSRAGTLAATTKLVWAVTHPDRPRTLYSFLSGTMSPGAALLANAPSAKPHSLLPPPA